MGKLFRIVGVLVVLLAAAAAEAQPAYRGGMAGGAFRITSTVDASGYYLVVQYRGNAVPEVETRLYGRSLGIRVSQAAEGAGGFFRNRMSRSFQLPPDADPAQMTRRDEPGRIVVAIPRRSAPAGPRW